MSKIEVIQKDITTLDTDAIVNAANSSLMGGSGVDGAIHDAAGIELLKECMTLGGCEVGEAKITKGYNLPCKYVIHTVGPCYYYKTANIKTYNVEEKLRNCYINSLNLAKEKGIKSIAFPCISTGVYGYPNGEAAEIAIKAVQDFLKDNEMDVIFCTFLDEDYELYKKLLG
jgi:O-acetyl-ADP-ribose deacetylase (regulator of RNase III)